MSDEARQCPVSPQELRLFAKHVLGGNYWPPRILELADWLEKPAPAFSSRCPHCDHAVHVGTCLQALRVGKPGEDVFCLCPASEPTRTAEPQQMPWIREVLQGFEDANNADAWAGMLGKALRLMVEHHDTAQARPTREQVDGAIVRGWCAHSFEDPLRQIFTSIADEIMKLLEGQ